MSVREQVPPRRRRSAGRSGGRPEAAYEPAWTLGPRREICSPAAACLRRAVEVRRLRSRPCTGLFVVRQTGFHASGHGRRSPLRVRVDLFARGATAPLAVRSTQVTLARDTKIWGLETVNEGGEIFTRWACGPAERDEFWPPPPAPRWTTNAASPSASSTSTGMVRPEEIQHVREEPHPPRAFGRLERSASSAQETPGRRRACMCTASSAIFSCRSTSALQRPVAAAPARRRAQPQARDQPPDRPRAPAGIRVRFARGAVDALLRLPRGAARLPARRDGRPEPRARGGGGVRRGLKGRWPRTQPYEAAHGRRLQFKADYNLLGMGFARFGGVRSAATARALGGGRRRARRQHFVGGSAGSGGSGSGGGGSGSSFLGAGSAAPPRLQVVRVDHAATRTASWAAASPR